MPVNLDNGLFKTNLSCSMRTKSFSSTLCITHLGNRFNLHVFSSLLLLTAELTTPVVAMPMVALPHDIMLLRQQYDICNYELQSYKQMVAQLQASNSELQEKLLLLQGRVQRQDLADDAGPAEPRTAADRESTAVAERVKELEQKLYETQTRLQRAEMTNTRTDDDAVSVTGRLPDAAAVAKGASKADTVVRSGTAGPIKAPTPAAVVSLPSAAVVTPPSANSLFSAALPSVAPPLLMLVSGNPTIAEVQAYISAGLDVNARPNPRTPCLLEMAVKNNRIDLVQLLVASDANINVLSVSGDHLITCNTQPTTIAALVTLGYDVNARSSKGATVFRGCKPFHYAELRKGNPTQQTLTSGMKEDPDALEMLKHFPQLQWSDIDATQLWNAIHTKDALPSQQMGVREQIVTVNALAYYLAFLQ
eukprot:TRINITY_DN2964_c0_g1_i1.p1 TRINITY_DN2964_c0_g1~~TRINITY_DN2964_c0_g1_i1.p1  ORF type:complete len:420 (+),score=82.62 TRINITY_DN2964_c0_g1_i1:571-1830(+)